MKIIGFVGLPGSGKSVASDVARKMGLTVLVMGDVIRQEASLQDLELTDENLGMLGNRLRAREGADYVAKRTLERAYREKIIVIDGLRSKEEADFFRANCDEFHLVKIVAPFESRIKWIVSRGRLDDPRAESDQEMDCCCHFIMQKALKKRERREKGWGMYEAMKEADLELRNDGDLEEFRRSVRDLLEKYALHN